MHCICVGYCYCCHLVRFTCWFVVLKPLAHRLVFPHWHHDTIVPCIHGRHGVLIVEWFRICCVLRLFYVLFCFATLASKLIFRWCFSSKRMLNRCCCIYPIARPDFCCDFVCVFNSKEKIHRILFSIQKKSVWKSKSVRFVWISQLPVTHQLQKMRFNLNQKS